MGQVIPKRIQRKYQRPTVIWFAGDGSFDNTCALVETKSGIIKIL
jgi:thiamine pyrophosphate-dependent acetolactate synthase large subunit-like protein